VSLLRLQRDFCVHERVNKSLSRVHVHIQESLCVARVSCVERVSLETHETLLCPWTCERVSIYISCTYTRVSLCRESLLSLSWDSRENLVFMNVWMSVSLEFVYIYKSVSLEFVYIYKSLLCRESLSWDSRQSLVSMNVWTSVSLEFVYIYKSVLCGMSLSWDSRQSLVSMNVWTSVSLEFVHIYKSVLCGMSLSWDSRVSSLRISTRERLKRVKGSSRDDLRECFPTAGRHSRRSSLQPFANLPFANVSKTSL